MFRSILVPLDGSALSEQALPVAASIARRSGARLHLARVHVPALLPPLMPGVPFNVEQRGAEREALERLAHELIVGGVPTDATLLDGDVAPTLLDFASHVGADLVVLTSHGRGPVARAIIGSVAHELTRRLTAPTLVLRAKREPPGGAAGDAPHAPGAKRLLIALDGSAGEEKTLVQAAELGEAMNAELTLLRVVEPVVSATPFEPGLADRERDAEATRRLQRGAQSRLERLAAPLRKKGVRVSTEVVVHPDPAAVIVEEAESRGCDVIALEPHAKTGVERLLFGSVSDSVRDRAPATLVTHAPDPDFDL